MKFEDLYNKVIKDWPATIDISDGAYIKKTKGYLFPSLSDVYHQTEEKTSNDWEIFLKENL